MGLIKSVFQSVLRKPGDSMSARITKTGRQVLKIWTNGGRNKRSATRYATGTIVETIVRKFK